MNKITLTKLLFLTVLLLIGIFKLEAQTLEEDALTKIDELKVLINQAEANGIDTLKEKTTIQTAEIFLEYAQWDEDNVPVNVEIFKKVSIYKNNATDMANLLPDFERNDIITMLDQDIAFLTKLINGEYTRKQSPNINWSQVSHSGDQLIYQGKPVFISDYNWKPIIEKLTKYHGNQDGFFLAPSHVADNTGAIKPFVRNNVMSKESGSIGFIFFNNSNVPSWAETEYGPGFNQGIAHRYTSYDIDNPGAKEMIGALVAGTVPHMDNKKYSELGYMLCNEPHFYSQKTGSKVAWASGPVSNYTIDKFKVWLATKHTTIARLNTLWGTSFSSFDDVAIEIPIDTSHAGSPMWYDWTLFNMHRVTEWYKFFKAEIRKHDDDAKVHLKLIPSHWTDNLRIHGLDFEALTDLSEIVGNDAGAAYNHLWKKNLEWEKNYAFEWRSLCMGYDFFKSIAPEKMNFNTEAHFLSKVSSRDLYMKPEYARATYWLAHTLGMTASQTWFWARREDGSPRGGVDNISVGYGGSNNHQPRVTNEVAHTMLDLNANSEIIMKMQRQRKPIRIFYSKTSAINKDKHMDDIFHLYEKLNFEGIPIGFVTKDVITNQDHSLWDVVLVHKSEFITAEEQAALQSYLDNGGTIIKDVISLTKNEYGESVITPLNTNNGGTILSASSLDNYKSQSLNIVDTKGLLPEVNFLETNGNGVNTCVWKTVKNDKGNNVLSIINLGNKDSSLNITLKNALGNTVLTDMLRGVTVSNTTVLKPYEMLFVEVTDDAALLSSVLPEEPYGFENTNVFWSSGGHDASIAGNIVEAWTQNPGFTQSSEKAKKGTYSMKSDLFANKGQNPKLQTFRTNINKEHKFTTEIASYDVKMWVYLEGDTPNGVKLILDTDPTKPQVVFDLTSIAKNQWVQVEATTKLVSTENSDTNWISLLMTGLNSNPSINSNIYFDDITMQKSTSLSITTIPTTEEVEIITINKKINVKAPVNSDIIVSNISGSIVYSIEKSREESILTKNLTPGIYIVKVTNKGEYTIRKIIVDK